MENKKFFEQAAVYAVFFSFAVIVLALFYEISFFISLGISMASTPLGIGDLSDTWIEKSAHLTILLSVLFCYDLILQKSTEEMEEKAIRKKANFFLIAIYLAALVFPLYGERFIISIWPFTTLLISVLLWSIMPKSMKEKLGKFRVSIIIFFMLYPFLEGFSDGSEIVTQIAESKGTITLNESEVDIVRIFEQWTLAKNDNGFVWINHSSGTTIKLNSYRKNIFTGVLCGDADGNSCKALYPQNLLQPETAPSGPSQQDPR